MKLDDLPELKEIPTSKMPYIGSKRFDILAKARVKYNGGFESIVYLVARSAPTQLNGELNQGRIFCVEIKEAERVNSNLAPAMGVFAIEQITDYLEIERYKPGTKFPFE